MSTIDNTDSNIDLKDLTIETCYNSGLGNLIDDIIKDQELLTFEDKSSIPIPPKLLEEGSIELSTKFDVKDNSDALIEIINEEKTALEFPFLISGIQKETVELTKFKMLYGSIENLKNSEVKMSEYSRYLYNGIIKAKKNNEDILVLGHTHPKPGEEITTTALTNKITPSIKEEYKIRELGLNFSLQDLYQLVYFEQAIKGTAKEGTKAMINVLMFNGDSVYVYIEDGKFKRAKIKEKGGTTAPPS
ncbi:MAG: hypothetical protein PHP08_02705 [Candidatus Dojkabacteria bacterium]|nr:hypothetical protein [Candidatus Dojkabacteria bacterium]